MNRAAIDLGSQSILLTVADEAGRVLFDEAQIVRLGEGLGDRGLFKPERMDAAREAIVEYARTALEFGVSARDVRAATTSAARRAMNAGTFFSRVERETGVRFRIVSGEEEARLTWLGARSGLSLPDGPAMVIDPGGGSTEFVIGRGERVSFRRSLEIGAVRLTEAHLGTGVVAPVALARLRAEVDQAIAGLALPERPRIAIAVAGTATTLAAMDAGLTDYDGERLHGYRLTAAAIRNWIDRLLNASPDERRALVAVSPQRADYMLAGASILARGLEATGRQSLCVSTRGLRFGLLADRPN